MLSAIRIALTIILATMFMASATAASADGVKPTPPPTPKGSGGNLNVETGKGFGKGSFSLLGGKAQDGQSQQKDWGGNTNSKKKIPAKDRRTIVLECWAKTHEVSCFDLDAPNGVSLLTGPLARAMAVNLVASLRFPAPKPIFGPDPNNNEWKMLAVGYPVWLWTQGPTTVSTSASSNGFTFRMTARWRSTTFHLGDGSTVTCTAMTKYSVAVEPGTASPNCGHVYTKPSLPKGKYQVRAVADWDVTWSVAGFSGVIPAYNEATSSIPIGELVALNR